jgi:hypothetical protein
MTMYRKHYRAVAEVIRSARELPDREQLAAVITGLEYVFKVDNPRFDRERFRAACHGD